MIESIELEKAVEGLKGIPYLHNGRTKNGVDCWGLVYLFFRELGLKLPLDDGREVSDTWYLEEPERYISGIRTLGEEVGHFINLQPLDLAYFRLYKNVITHSAVMLDRFNFIHVLIGKDVRVDTMRKGFWRRKYAGAIRLRMVKDFLA